MRVVTRPGLLHLSLRALGSDPGQQSRGSVFDLVSLVKSVGHVRPPPRLLTTTTAIAAIATHIPTTISTMSRARVLALIGSPGPLIDWPAKGAGIFAAGGRS